MIIAAWVIGIIMMPILAMIIAQVFMSRLEGVFTLFSDLMDLFR